MGELDFEAADADVTGIRVEVVEKNLQRAASNRGGADFKNKIFIEY